MAPHHYYVDDKSRRILQDTVRTVRAGKTSSRPVPTRRPPRSGGRPTINIVEALVIANIDAATMTDTTLTPGITADTVKVMQWDDPADSLSVDGDAVAGVNFSKSIFRGSTGEPVAVHGYRKTVRLDDEDVDGFVITGVYDLRMLPGFDAAAASPQVPHSDGESFTLDSEDCA